MGAIKTDKQNKSQQLNWQRVINHLSGQARRRHTPLPPDELSSLAGIAVAKAKDYYDPNRATCSFREWIYSQGWRLMLSEIRDELRRRRRSVPDVTFTDLGPVSNMSDGWQGIEMILVCRQQSCFSLSSLLVEFSPSLSVEEIKLIYLRLHHWTYRQIGRESGISGEAIRQRMLKIRKTVAGSR